MLVFIRYKMMTKNMTVEIPGNYIFPKSTKAEKKTGSTSMMKSLYYFGLVWFYGISTTGAYLMLNPVYTYILNIYDLWTHFVHNLFKWAWANSLLHTIKWFQILQSNTNYTIQYYSLICTRLNGSKYWYVFTNNSMKL